MIGHEPQGQHLCDELVTTAESDTTDFVGYNLERNHNVYQDEKLIERCERNVQKIEQDV